MIHTEHSHPPDQSTNKARKLVSFIRKRQCSLTHFLDAIKYQTGLRFTIMFHVLFFNIKNGVDLVTVDGYYIHKSMVVIRSGRLPLCFSYAISKVYNT